MPRVVHFEISADQPERAIDFYSTVFGWEFKKWDGPFDYWMAMTGKEGEPGIDGGLMLRQKELAAGHVNTIDVESVDDYVSRVLESGGKVVVPKMEVAGVGHMAYCADTEGNVFGIIEMQPQPTPP